MPARRKPSPDHKSLRAAQKSESRTFPRVLLLALLLTTGLAGCATTDDAPPVSIEDSPRAREIPPTPDPAPLPPESRALRNSYSSVPVNEPLIALTFDDGPHPHLTPRLLDILRERGVQATFYVIGDRVEAHPEIARRIVREGHEIANHSRSHPAFAPMTREAVRHELRHTHDVILATTGVAPLNMRPPYGSITADQKEWIFREFGYPTILWDVDPLDWRRPGAGVVAQRILSETRHGSIILAHDIHPGTIEAMPIAMDGLLARGFRFVTVSELISREAAP